MWCWFRHVTSIFMIHPSKLEASKQVNKLLNWFLWHEHNTLRTHGNRTSCVGPHSYKIYPNGAAKAYMKFIQFRIALFWQLNLNATNIVCTCAPQILTHQHIWGPRVLWSFQMSSNRTPRIGFKSVRFHFVRKTKQGNKRMNARKTMHHTQI